MRKTLTGVALAAASVLCMGVGTASAASTTQVVKNGDVARQPENTPPTRNWVIYNRNAGNATFVNGPASPPLGIGSLQLNTPTGADKIQAFNYDHVGTPLSAVDAMGYSTYRSAGSADQDTAINVEVDVNGTSTPGGFTTLVFEPVYNTNQGAVASNQWQTWDAYNGGNAIWWSSNPIPGAPNRDTFVTWSSIVTANPDAVIVGGYGLNQGSGNPALTVADDALVFGASGDRVTYDFEPGTVPPSSKDQCKGNGWQAFSNPSFKNQGDCVSYVSTGGKNGPNG
jgi:hypothetical protein